MRILSKYLFLFALTLVFCCSSIQAQEAARQLAKRLLGSRAQEFEFYTYKQWTEMPKHEYLHSMPVPVNDSYSFFQNGKKICIVANNDLAMCMALNHYLKDYANVSVSWYASEPIQLPKRFPKVDEEQSRCAQMTYRFFLNYCTYGYTMPWWGWEQWERFIDWMALNGINMPLALTGQEAVWQEVWREYGFADNDIRTYFSSPAHLPWHRMANLDYFGGPLPQSWIDGQKELQKRILKRERELNMTPVLPAFAGHVPMQLKNRFPQADIKALDAWCGFAPTFFLNSTDSLFPEIQRKYLEKQTALYGTNHIYGIDPFNEMEPPSWEPDYLANVSLNIYGSLHRVDTAAKWLQMSWVFYYKQKQWTPERLKAYLTAVPQDKMILLDYFCEKTEVWRQTQRFYGQPFIWCYLGNFGGNTMLVGDIPALGDKLDKAMNEVSSAWVDSNMIGIGSTLESFDNSPQIFEYLFEHQLIDWRKTLISSLKNPIMPKGTTLARLLSEWVMYPQLVEHTSSFAQRWADRRYGEPNSNARRAWQLLIDSVYKDWSFYGLGTQMTARPSLEGHGTYYTKPYYSYSNDQLLEAIHLLMKKPSNRASFQYDVANLLSQWMANHFMEVRNAFTQAYRQGDIDAMTDIKNIALELMRDCDALLYDIPECNFWQWTDEARNLGTSEKEKDYYERQARTLLTIWGGPVLNDYANRLWGGLIKGYYRQRWERFFIAVIQSVEQGHAFDAKAFDVQLSAYEKDWVTYNKGGYTKPKPDQVMEHVREILDKQSSGAYNVPNYTQQRLQEYMLHYPDAQLCDVYKWCFQDVYGPGHLITDSLSCANYITKELEQVDVNDTLFPDIETTGINGHFVRVNLRLVKSGVIPVEKLVSVLMRSAQQKQKLPIYDWRGIWVQYEKLLKVMNPAPANFDEDHQLLQALFDRNQYMFHHSESFNQHYHPHYRIIATDLFDSELKPLLNMDPTDSSSK